MPHGGYHGEVRIGNKVVQQASRPDGKGGQTGGGRYRAKGYNKKPKNLTYHKLIQKSSQILVLYLTKYTSYDCSFHC